MKNLSLLMLFVTSMPLIGMDTGDSTVCCTMPDEAVLEKLLRDEQVAFFISPLKKIAGKTMGISQFLEAVDAAVCEESLMSVAELLRFQRYRVIGALLKNDPKALGYIANKGLFYTDTPGKKLISQEQ